jgi:hypothetical protein
MDRVTTARHALAPSRRLAASLGAVSLLIAVLAGIGIARSNAVVPPAAHAELAVSTPAAPAPAIAAGAPPATLNASPSPSPSPCAITRPGPAFTPPKPYLARPPKADDSVWYGDAHLWTMLHVGGETWGPWLFATPPGLPQKTFWWSADWHPEQTGEWEPAISVTGRRLDGPETFTFGPGTNASADFGTAMLVGIDIPSYGCWELTADYREATLSYVVSVVNP